MGGEIYQTPGREIGEVPKGSGYTHRTLCVRVCVSVCVCGGVHLCISVNMPVCARVCVCVRVCGRGGMPVRVNINKLQARVRYTHITCRYLWINRPELPIVREASTVPTAANPPPSWVKTLCTSHSFLQIPKGTVAPGETRIQSPSWAIPSPPPP